MITKKIGPKYECVQYDLRAMLAGFTQQQRNYITINDDESNEILGYSDIESEVKTRYTGFHVNAMTTDADNFDESNAVSDLYDKIVQWRTRRIDGIKKAWAALNAEYNPIENYDRYEDPYEDKHKVVVDGKVQHNTKLKESNNADRKVSTNTDVKTSNSGEVITTEEDSTMTKKNPTWLADNVQTGQTITDPGQVKSESDPEKNYSETKANAANNYSREVAAAADNYKQTEGLATDNYVKDDTTTNTTDTIAAKHLHGNIGTTKSQEMVSDEIELRKLDFKADLVKELVYSIAFI